MHREVVQVLFVATVAAALTAQRPLSPETFRPDQPEGELRVDLEQIRETGVWEEIEHSLLAPVLRRGEEETGLDFSALDTVWMWIRVAEDEGRMRPRRVAAIAGVVDGATMFEDWSAMEVNGRTVRFPRRFDRELGLQESGLLVVGDRKLVEAPLSGDGPPGVPRPDQLSLLASARPALVHFYAFLPSARDSNGEFGFLNEIAYPADDPAEHLVLRLQAVGDPLDPHLELSGTVRHRRGAAGLEATEAAARAWLVDLKAMPELALFRSTLDAVEFERDGFDLTARVDLGRARDAVGTVAQLALPWFMLRRSAQAAAQAAEVKAAEIRKVELERALREQAEKAAEEERKREEEPKPQPEAEPPRPKPRGGNGG